MIGPGDLYTSVIPNFLVTGMAKAIKSSRARKIYLCNLMTKNGETNNFSAMDFLATIEDYIGRDVVDYVLVNAKKPGNIRLKRYAEENAELVTLPKDYKDKLNKTEIIKADLLTKSGLIRHDPKKLSNKILNLL